MVAISGPGWRLAPSLRAYVDEADEVFPNRDTSSDGSIGDLAHSVRVSDHNPDDGYVDAVDLDEDLAPGVTLMPFAEHLRTGKDPRVKYVIYEGRMFSSYATSSRAAWRWGPYSGINAHTHHLHLSILHTDAARNDLRAWGFAPASTQEPDDLMAAADDILKAIATVKGKVETTYNHVTSRTGMLYNELTILKAEVAALRSAVSQLGVGGSVDYSKVQAAAEAAVRKVAADAATP